MPQYKISVILPVFMADKYLENSFRSLQKQSIGFENLEIIYIDDKSPDKSGEIIDTYAKQYANVTAIHTGYDSGSAGRPRNIGLEMSTSDYIMYLDPDDTYGEDACFSLYQEIVGSKYDFVGGYYTELHSVGDSAHTCVEQKFFSRTMDFTLPDDFCAALPMRIGFWTKIYKKEFLIKNRITFPEKILCEDMVFALRALLNAHTCRYVEKNIVFYYIRDSNDKSASFNISMRLLRDAGEAYHLLFEQFIEKGMLDPLDIILRDVPDYYFRQITQDGSLREKDYKALLYEWKWIFDYLQKRNVKFELPVSQKVAECLKTDNYDKAVRQMVLESYIQRFPFKELIRQLKKHLFPF